MMSKKMSKEKIGACLNHVNPWETAIADAKNQIGQAQNRIATLRRAIKAFEVMRDSGEPWPGTSETTEKASQRASSA